MADRTENDVTIEVDGNTRRLLKVVASLEGQSMKEWLAWVVAKAYESKVRANKKK